MSFEQPAIKARQWPADFAHPRARAFYKAGENQSFLDSLRENREFPDDSDDDSSDSDSDSEDDEADDGNDDGNDDGEARGVGEAEEDAIDAAAAACDERGTPRSVGLFMRGSGESEQRSVPIHDRKIVRKFCEHYFSIQESQGESRRAVAPRIAIVDIRSTVGVDGGNGASISRPQHGGLTESQLREVLNMPRFAIPVDEKGEGNLSEDPSVDADRVVIYLSNMGASGIIALSETARRSERLALTRLFYDHIKPSPSVGVKITKNFPTFTLHVNIPFFALREDTKERKDSRKKPNGSPLRRSWPLKCLPSSTSAKPSPQQHYFYESQTSIVLTGFDDRTYTAYGVVDTYYERKCRNSVAAHHRKWKKTGVILDPIAVSEVSREVNKSYWDARLYFLDLWQGHIEQALEEWVRISRMMKEMIDKSRAARSQGKSRSSKRLQDFNIWNEKIQEDLNIFISILHGTIRAWDEFLKGDLGYFTSDEDATRTVRLQNIATAYSCLKGELAALEGLPKLVDGNRNEIQNVVNFQTHDAAASALRFTIIAVCSAPLSQATGLFNMQGGVLPFDANTLSFILCFITLGVIYFAACGLYFNWEDLSEAIVLWVQNAIHLPSPVIFKKNTTTTATTAKSLIPRLPPSIDEPETTQDLELHDLQAIHIDDLADRLGPRLQHPVKDGEPAC